MVKESRREVLGLINGIAVLAILQALHQNSKTDTRVFVATFDGGSVVRMQLLRPKSSAATAALH